MSHPKSQAERRTIRRQFIRKRIKNGRHWTSCQCGDGYWWWHFQKPFPTWRHSGKQRAWYESRLCWNCFGHTYNPAWTGKLDKWHVHPEPNRERDWDYAGIIRRDFRNGGGGRGNEWGAKRGKFAGRFRIYLAEREWGELDTDYASIDMSDQDTIAGWSRG